MYPVKQSTALDVLFFAHDANGDGVTGIADGSFTKRISKNAGAFAAQTVTISERENGWYLLPLSSAHTDTNGVLTISLSASGIKRVNLQFRVSTRITDDLCFPNTSGRGIDVDASGGVEVGSFQTGAITSGAFAAGAIDAASIATDAITAAKIAADAIGASELAADAVAEIADQVWDEARSGHTTAGSFGQGVASVQGNITGSVDSIGASGLASINGEVVDVVNVDTISELAQATPPTNPTMRQAIMLLYMAIRNETLVTSSLISFKDNAGTVTYKKTISDDGTTFTKQKLVSGP